MEISFRRLFNFFLYRFLLRSLNSNKIFKAKSDLAQKEPCKAIFVLIISQAYKVGCAPAMGFSSDTEYQHEPPYISAKIVVN